MYWLTLQGRETDTVEHTYKHWWIAYTIDFYSWCVSSRMGVNNHNMKPKTRLEYLVWFNLICFLKGHTLHIYIAFSVLVSSNRSHKENLGTVHELCISQRGFHCVFYKIFFYIKSILLSVAPWLRDSESNFQHIWVQAIRLGSDFSRGLML